MNENESFPLTKTIATSLCDYKLLPIELIDPVQFCLCVSSVSRTLQRSAEVQTHHRVRVAVVGERGCKSFGRRNESEDFRAQRAARLSVSVI